MTAGAQTERRGAPARVPSLSWTRLFGTTANQMLFVALAWQMYDLTGRAWDLGMVGLMQFVPALVCALPAGQLVDRVDRRRVLAASLIMQAAASLVLAWGSLHGWIGREIIFGICVALGSRARSRCRRSRRSFPRWCSRRAAARVRDRVAAAQLAVVGGPYLAASCMRSGRRLSMRCASCCWSRRARRSMIAPILPARDQAPGRGRRCSAGSFIWQRRCLAISLDLAVLPGGATAAADLCQGRPRDRTVGGGDPARRAGASR
jgi:hypothetical protein